MSGPIDFDGINRAALANARSLLSQLVPGGKFRSLEYVVRNPTRNDRKPGSFSINYKNGVWKDFATGDGGGDVISWLAYVKGLSQAEAARELADELGVPLTSKANGTDGHHQNGAASHPSVSGIAVSRASSPAAKVHDCGEVHPTQAANCAGTSTKTMKVFRSRSKLSSEKAILPSIIASSTKAIRSDSNPRSPMATTGALYWCLHRSLRS